MHNRVSDRTTRRILSAALLLMGIGVTPLAAQGGGSSYSIFNLGDLLTGTTAAGAGRAGIETANPYGTILNSVNPATWTSLRFVTFQAGMTFEQYKVSDRDGSLWQNKTSLRNFSAAFPYSEKYGGTIGIGFRPYSTVNYRTAQSREVPLGDTGKAPAELTYSGSGGLSEAFLGTSFMPLDWLSLGVTGSLYFGSIENRTLVDFPTTSLNNAGYINSDRLSGFGGTLGLMVRATDDLRIGGTFSLPATIDVDRTQLGVFREGGSDDTVSISDSAFGFDLPPRITVGASYRTGRTVLSGETVMQSWSGHSRFGGTARNRMRLGVGADYLPSTSASASGTDRWTFRAGAWYEQTYYAVPQGDINAMGVTLGAFVPFSTIGRLGSGAGMDLGIELGTRGTTENGLTQELFGKVSVELSINELWFQTSRR